MSGVYYCFTATNDIEQDEAGDTTRHTFTVDDWPFSQLRYFYFYGQIGGIDSPSQSCIFDYLMPITGPLMNGDFERWEDPAGDPVAFTKYQTGRGQRLWEREEVQQKEGLFCPKFSAYGAGCTTQYQQFFGAQYYRGETVRFTFWEKGSQGIARLRGVGGQRFYFFGASGTWEKHTKIGLVGPTTRNICFWFGARSTGNFWRVHYFDLLEIERL